MDAPYSLGRHFLYTLRVKYQMKNVIAVHAALGSKTVYQYTVWQC